MKDENSRQGKDGTVNPLLWEVICSTLLTNPAEQSVVQHVIGETFIQESLLLHREAHALLDILSAAASTCDSRPVENGKCVQPVPHTRRLGKDGHPSLVEKVPPVRSNTPTRRSNTPTRRASTPTCCSRSHVKGDGIEGGHELLLADAQMHHLSPYPNVLDAQNFSRYGDGQRSNKAKQNDEDIHGICQSQYAAREDVNGVKMQKKAIKIKKEDALQRSTLSSSLSSSSDKTKKLTRNSTLHQPHDLCVNDSVRPTDFSAFLRDCGDKINAYDIDEVVNELRKAFAAEQVYLNHLVEQLRRALDNCIDCYPMAKSTLAVDCTKETIKHVKKKGDFLKNESSRGITTPHARTKAQVGQKFSAFKETRPSSLTTSKSTQIEMTSIERSSSILLKVSSKSELATSKHVLATPNTNKLPTSSTKEGKKSKFVPLSSH